MCLSVAKSVSDSALSRRRTGQHGVAAVAVAEAARRTVFFFGNFGSEIQIGNQQVLGQNWVKKW